jgi:hypothetical protein
MPRNWETLMTASTDEREAFVAAAGKIGIEPAVAASILRHAGTVYRCQASARARRLQRWEIVRLRHAQKRLRDLAGIEDLTLRSGHRSLEIPDISEPID